MAAISKYTKSKIDDAELERCKKELKKILGRKPEVFTILRHVSKSGMTRAIGVVVPRKSPMGGYSIFYLDYMVATVLGYRQRAKGSEGIIVHGCGQDMGFHLVHSLSTKLYGDGYKIQHRWL